MNTVANESPWKQLKAAVAACRACMPRKRNVILRLCIRRIFTGKGGGIELGLPFWVTWDGTRSGLIELLKTSGPASIEWAGHYRFTLAATHRSMSFSDAMPAMRDVSDIIRQFVQA